MASVASSPPGSVLLLRTRWSTSISRSSHTFLWVTKRLLKGIFVTLEGWPEGSPMLSSTVNSYRVLWRCHRRLTPKYRGLVSEARHHKRVYHLRSSAEMGAFLATLEGMRT